MYDVITSHVKLNKLYILVLMSPKLKNVDIYSSCEEWQRTLFKILRLKLSYILESKNAIKYVARAKSHPPTVWSTMNDIKTNNSP